MFARVDELDVAALHELAAGAAWRRPSQLFLRNQALAEIQRVQGVAGGAPAGRFWGTISAEGPRFGSFFGTTRVVCIGPGDADDGASLRRIAVGPERGFRIVIGPREPTTGFLDSVRSRLQITMERSQPFLIADDRSTLGQGIAARPGAVGDVDWLVEASIHLNEEDLEIPARSVDRALLEQRVRERIQQGSTWIVERNGRAACKLEIGNDGPAGALIEGVYTALSFRGQGLARRLCAEVANRILHTRCRVGLHVGRENEAAQRAYRAAGFREVEDLVLALVNWI